MDINQVSSQAIPNFAQSTASDLAHGILGGGKKVFRLELTPDNSVLKVAAKELTGKESKLLNNFRYVNVEVGGKNYAVNIRSLAKRLGLTSAEAKSLTQNEGWEGITDAAGNRAKVLEKYEALAKKYETNLFGKLKVQNTTLSFGAKTLCKVCSQAIDKNGEFPSGTIKVSKHLFHVTEDLTQIIKSEKKIAEGGFGVVFRSTVIDHSKDLIDVQIRASKHSKGIDSLNDLQKEFEAAEIFGKDVPGLHLDISKVTVITDAEGKKSGFYHTELMSGDLMECADDIAFHRESAEKRLSLCAPLLKGLKAIHDQGYAHKDLKLENILMKKDENDNIEKFAISDFGLFTKPNSEKDSWAGTQSYIPIDSPKDRMKADVFALSSTLIKLLIGQELQLPSREKEFIRTKIVDDQEIEELYTHTYPNPQHEKYPEKLVAIKQELIKANIPESVADVLISGLKPINERPNAEKLLSEFTSACEKMSENEKKLINKELVLQLIS